MAIHLTELISTSTNKGRVIVILVSATNRTGISIGKTSTHSFLSPLFNRSSTSRRVRILLYCFKSSDIADGMQCVAKISSVAALAFLV